MANPMDKQPQQNPQNPQQQQTQNPQKSAAPQNPGSKQRDPNQGQQGNPQDRYASGTDRSRDVPIDRKGGQTKPENARPGFNEDNDKSGKREQ